MKRFVILFSLLAVLGALASSVEAATLSPAPSASGLVGYWSFNEGTSTRATDFSGNSNTGTLTNMDAATDWVTGKFGKALDFDGVNDYITLPNGASLQSATGGSILAWYKPTANPSGNAALYYESTTSDGSSRFALFHNTNGDLQAVMRDTNSGAAFTATETDGADSNLNQWMHIAVTVDTTTDNLLLYRNGIQVAVNSTSKGAFTAGNPINSIVIGAYRGGGNLNYISGALDDVRIYNRALSATEIVQLYSSGAATRRQVSQNGLMGHWRFDEGTSTRAVDYSDNGNAGTLTNMDAATDWVAGKLGKALDFDGSNDHVVVSDSNTIDIGQGASATLAVWYYSQNDTAERVIYSKRSSDSSTATDYMLFTTGGQLVFGTGSSADSCAWQTVSEPSKNEWHHIVGTLSSTGSQSGTKRLYIDGVLVDSCTYSIKTASNSSSLFIGRPVANGSYWRGKIDDFRIYNRALSVAEVTALYSSGATTRRQVSQNGLVGHWRFDEGTSTRATDFSGNGNTGTLTNMSAPATDTSGWGNGKIGKGLVFDGSNDYVTAPAPTISGAQPRTLAFWANNKSPTQNTSFVGFGQAASTGRWFYATVASGRYYFSGYFNDWDTGVTSTAGWHHHVLTYDGATVRWYVDTIELGSGVAKTLNTGTGDIYIGRRGALNDYFLRGSIDDVRLYNRVLSASEIQTLYQYGN